jgi:uncharacterized iron-regulated membrane protein
VILVLSGIYLWWPRGQGGGVVGVRGTPRRRVQPAHHHHRLGVAPHPVEHRAVIGVEVDERPALFSYRTVVAVRATPPLSPERLVFIAAEAVPDAAPKTYAG